MNHLKSFPIVYIVLLPFLLIGCTTPKELEYRSFKNFVIDKAGFASTTIRMDVVYYNPNNFGLQLQRTDLDVYIDNNYLGHTIQEQQISIPKRDEFSVPIKIDVDMKNLLKNGFTTLFNNEVTLKITGTVRVGKGAVFKNFPVSYEGKQKFSLFE